MTTYLPSPNVAVTSAVRHPDTLKITAFKCRGLEDLSRSLGFSVAVVAAVKDPDRHVRRLGETWYASGVPMDYDEWPLPFDFDNFFYRDWWQVPIDERWFGGTSHPLSTCVEDGSLLVRLPMTVSAGNFAASFRDGLSSLRFETVARRPSHCVKRRHTSRRVAVTSRYSRASAADPTPIEVRDLISFQPRSLPRIADIAFMTLVRLIAMAEG